MSVSLVHCPECNTLLLGDTVQCPTCHHVLDAKAGAAIVQPEAPADPSDAHDICPGCGESVRRGLVRCFNCGTFMRGEIAESYQRLKSTPSQVIYSEVPGGETEADTVDLAPDTPPPVSKKYDEPFSTAVDDDFELAPDIVADEEDFDEDFEVEPEQSNQVFDEVDHAYRLLQDEKDAEAEVERAQVEVARQAAEDEAARAAQDAADQDDDDEEDDTARRRARFDEENDEAHSVATGGDVLLKVALEEEAEVGRRRFDSGQRRGEGPVVATGIMVYCPNGHRVEVQERHRGKTGRCPRCREPFFVPAGAWHEEEAEPVKKPEAEEEFHEAKVDAPYKVKAGEYSYYMRDVQYHTVDVSKLKLKPGSLEKLFEPVDLAFAPFGALVITLAKKKGGLFASSKKLEPDKIRDSVIEHLSDERPLEQLPVGEHRLLNADEVKKIRIVQPAPTDYESMFAGIPVFGKGIVAVRFAKVEGETEQKFASFVISEFRVFAEAMREVYDMVTFGEDCGIPLVNLHTELKCHYSDDVVKSLEQLEYYQADDAYKLVLTGRKCAECGLVVSEEARKKEKLGGSNGKAIAKAKCPKCTKKFGDISLYAIESGPSIGAEKVEAEHG